VGVHACVNCLSARLGRASPERWPEPHYGQSTCFLQALFCQFLQCGNHVSAWWLQRGNELEGVGGQRCCRPLGVDTVRGRPAGSIVGGLFWLCQRRPSTGEPSARAVLSCTISSSELAVYRQHAFGLFMGTRPLVSAGGRETMSRQEVVELQCGEFPFGGVARAAATLSTEVRWQIWLRSCLSTRGGDEGRPGRLWRAPPCSEARVMHTCFLLLGGGAASAVSASSGRGEEAASELSAVSGFVRFPRSRQEDGSPTGCWETGSRFGERWSIGAWQESLTRCGEVSLSFRGRCFSRLFD
jgi:hypothetical protein